MSIKSRYITVEGIDGVGKTYFLEKLKEKNPHVHIILDTELDGLGKKIFDALQSQKRFLGQGFPLAEALCFCAIDLIDVESRVIPNLKKNISVLQDRGIDSICVYGAVSLQEKRKISFEEAYLLLFTIRKKLNIIPEKTILLYDDINRCIQRAEQRDKKTFTREEKEFLKKVDYGFRRIQKIFPRRIILLNRRNKSEGQILKEIQKLV